MKKKNKIKWLSIAVCVLFIITAFSGVIDSSVDNTRSKQNSTAQEKSSIQIQLKRDDNTDITYRECVQNTVSFLQPTVVITSPENGSVFTEPEVTLIGYAADELGINYINYTHEWEEGATCSSWTIDPPVGYYEFAWELVLYEGWNRITVTAGNVESSYGSEEITVYYYPEGDNIPPVVTIINPANDTVVHTPHIDVTGWAYDADSGIVRMDYLWEWEGGSTSDYSTFDPPQQEITFRIEILNLQFGWNRVTAMAKDAAGNEGGDSVTIYYYLEDTTPPTTTKTVGEPQYDDGFYVTSETLFTLTAEDNEGGSGVKAIYYRIWNNETGNKSWDECWTDWMEYDEPFNLIGNCTNHVEYYAVDNAGNEEEIHTQTHSADNKAPVTILDFNQPYYFASNSELGEHVVCSKETTVKKETTDYCGTIKSFTIKNVLRLLQPWITVKYCYKIKGELKCKTKRIDPGDEKEFNISKKATLVKVIIFYFEPEPPEHCRFELTAKKLKEMAKKNGYLPVEGGYTNEWDPEKKKNVPRKYDEWFLPPGKKGEIVPKNCKGIGVTISRFKIWSCKETVDRGTCCNSTCKIVINNTCKQDISYKYSYVKSGKGKFPSYNRKTNKLAGKGKNKEKTFFGKCEKIKMKWFAIKIVNEKDQTLCTCITTPNSLVKAAKDANYKSETSKKYTDWKVESGKEMFKLECVNEYGEAKDERCNCLAVKSFRAYKCKKKDTFLDGDGECYETYFKPSYSGVYSTRYRIKRDGSTWTDWMEYDGPFTFDEYGLYYLEYYSIDNVGNEEVINNETIVVEDIHSPDKPSRPSGPARGKPGREYTYATSTTDADNDQVYYLFCWGDGNTSGWLGPYAPSEICEASHVWEEEGNYNVSVIAMDEPGCLSEWSDPLPIIMPKTYNNLLLTLIEKLFDWLTQILDREILPGILNF